jgi:molybdopterin/thiamine biosynthesis adenylyltransferase
MWRNAKDPSGVLRHEGYGKEAMTIHPDAGLRPPPLVEPADELDFSEIRRYSRHLIIPDVAMTGQKRLKNAKVLCIGAGGLGSPVAMYLAAAGVGTIGMVDFDVVDETNLQRQVIHGTSDVGRKKLDSAEDSIREINPFVKIVKHETMVSSENAMQLFEPYDLIVDGSDNFPTRYLVNDACVLLGKPYVWGSIFRFDGQISVFWAEHGPCYRCLYPEPPPPGMVPSCAEGGVLGMLCGTIGSLQTTEAVKLITGIGDPMIGRMMIYDALEMKFKELRVRKDPECPVCGISLMRPGTSPIGMRLAPSIRAISHSCGSRTSIRTTSSPRSRICANSRGVTDNCDANCAMSSVTPQNAS